MSRNALDAVSKACFVAGIISILGSIAIFLLLPGDDPAFRQRLGIFVGLWAPTFFILSGRFATQEVVDAVTKPSRAP